MPWLLPVWKRSPLVGNDDSDWGGVDGDDIDNVNDDNDFIILLTGWPLRWRSNVHEFKKWPKNHEEVETSPT